MRSHTIFVPTDTLVFCRWLDNYVAAANVRLEPGRRVGAVSYPYLTRPKYLDAIKAQPPYVLTISMMSLTRNEPHQSRSYNSVGNRISPRPVQPDIPRLALSVTITEIGDGIRLEIQCDDTKGIVLEDFVSALDKLSTAERARLLEPSPEKERVQLSARENEILKLVVSNGNPQDIAATCGITVAGVSSHIQNISKKLGVRTTKSPETLRRELKDKG